MHRLMILLLSAVLVAALPSCTTSENSHQASQTSIVYGLTLQPSGFDPHINASSEIGIPLRSVYDTLVYREPNTQAFVPGLATSWLISDDGLIYTFQLRQDVRFHDGTPFNAQAVAANLDRITNPATASQKAVFLLGSYDRYEILDDYTIRLYLTEPFSPLLDSLSQVYLGIASPDALAEYGNDVYQFHQVGTGPYRFVDYLPGDHLTLRRNEDYQWAPNFYEGTFESAPDEIIFRFYEDPPSRALMLESGNVEIVGELLPTDARNMSSNSQLRVMPVAIPGQPLQFIMNTDRYPTDDERFRQALLYATNREAIIDSVFQRFSPVAWGPLSAVTQFYAPEVIGRYAYDLSQAQALLQSMGLTDSDSNGYLDFGGADIEVALTVPTWGLIPQVAQLIQDQWRDVGIRAVINQVPSRSALFERLESGNFNLAAVYEFGIDPAFLRRYYTSGGVNNYTGYSDSALDNLLYDAERELNADARQSLYSQAQNIIMERALVLPIRDYVNLNGYQADIQGLSFDAYGWFPLLLNLQVPET